MAQAITARTSGCRSKPACGGSAPITWTSTGSTCGTGTLRSKRLCRALDDEVRGGRNLHVGISDTPAWIVAQANTLADWRDWTTFAGLQVPYSLLQRDIERELLPMAEAFGMTVAAWSPLSGGILSGKFTREQARFEGPDRSVVDHTTATERGNDCSVGSRRPGCHPLTGGYCLDTNTIAIIQSWVHAESISFSTTLALRR